MEKHTPGPWTVDESLIVEGNGEEIAEVYGNSQGHAEANAHLIAAAPELREHLATIIAAWEADYVRCVTSDGRTVPDVFGWARALLARIDGRTGA